MRNRLNEWMLSECEPWRSFCNFPWIKVIVRTLKQIAISNSIKTESEWRFQLIWYDCGNYRKSNNEFRMWSVWDGFTKGTHQPDHLRIFILFFPFNYDSGVVLSFKGFLNKTIYWNTIDSISIQLTSWLCVFHNFPYTQWYESVSYEDECICNGNIKILF